MRPQRPTRAPHGTETRYRAGCSCILCCEAHAIDAAEVRRLGRRNVNPAAVREHIVRLRGAGLLMREIAWRAGVSRTTIRALRDGEYGTVKRQTAEAVLGVDAR